MAESRIAADERRKRETGGVRSRADLGLRTFWLEVGGAVMCPGCGGAGYVLTRGAFPKMHDGSVHPTLREYIDHPVRCGVCKGEGLDPEAIQGGE